MFSRTIAITVVTLTCLLASACGSNIPPLQSLSATDSPSIAPSPKAAKTIVQPVQSEPIVISSLQERIAKSSVIVLGEIIDQGKVFNAARDVSDRTKPATNLFGVGQIYHVRAIRYLKGTGPEILNIFQAEGMIDGDSSTITPTDIAEAKAVYGYLPFAIGKQYVLFLNPFKWDDVVETLYGGSAGAASPWRFTLLPDGTLNAEGPGIGALVQTGGEFAPRPLADFTAQVEQLVQAEKAATPPK